MRVWLISRYWVDICVPMHAHIGDCTYTALVASIERHNQPSKVTFPASFIVRMKRSHISDITTIPSAWELLPRPFQLRTRLFSLRNMYSLHIYWVSIGYIYLIYQLWMNTGLKVEDNAIKSSDLLFHYCTCNPSSVPFQFSVPRLSKPDCMRLRFLFLSQVLWMKGVVKHHSSEQQNGI